MIHIIGKTNSKKPVTCTCVMVGRGEMWTFSSHIHPPLKTLHCEHYLFMLSARVYAFSLGLTVMFLTTLSHWRSSRRSCCHTVLRFLANLTHQASVMDGANAGWYSSIHLWLVCLFSGYFSPIPSFAASFSFIRYSHWAVWAGNQAVMEC